MWIVLIIIVFYLFIRSVRSRERSYKTYYFRVKEEQLPEFINVIKENSGEIVSISKADNPENYRKHNG